MRLWSYPGHLMMRDHQGKCRALLLGNIDAKEVIKGPSDSVTEAGDPRLKVQPVPHIYQVYPGHILPGKQKEQEQILQDRSGDWLLIFKVCKGNYFGWWCVGGWMWLGWGSEEGFNCVWGIAFLKNCSFSIKWIVEFFTPSLICKCLRKIKDCKIFEEMGLMLHALWKLMVTQWRLAEGVTSPLIPWTELNFMRCAEEWFQPLTALQRGQN